MMIPWNGEEMSDPRLRPHEPVWLEWYDYQASCNWYQCRRCQEKFYIGHELLDKKPGVVWIEAYVNELHNKRIEKLASGIH